MLLEPVDLEYSSYAQLLSLGGSSDEAAARIVQHSVLAASVSAGMGAVLPPALRQMFASKEQAQEQPRSPIGQP